MAGPTIVAIWKCTVLCDADFRNIFLFEFEHHLATSILDFILQREMRKNTNLLIETDLSILILPCL